MSPIPETIDQRRAHVAQALGQPRRPLDLRAEIRAGSQTDGTAWLFTDLGSFPIRDVGGMWVYDEEADCVGS